MIPLSLLTKINDALPHIFNRLIEGKFPNQTLAISDGSSTCTITYEGIFLKFRFYCDIPHNSLASLYKILAIAAENYEVQQAFAFMICSHDQVAFETIDYTNCVLHYNSLTINRDLQTVADIIFEE